MNPNFLNANMPPIAAVIAIKEVSAPHCTALSSSSLGAVLVGWVLAGLVHFS